LTDESSLTEVGTHLPRLCHSQAVQRSDSNVDDLLPPQTFHHLGLPHVDVGAVTQPEVVSFAPVWKRGVNPLRKKKTGSKGL